VDPTYTRQHIEGRAVEQPHGQVAAITLGTHETAWNPASTKNLITGPGQVVYTFHHDGGIDVAEMGPGR
jgi:hypothetical protein